MATTTYSIHSAYNHEIWATAVPGNLQDVVRRIAAANLTNQGATTRFYVHNGLGVVGAFLTRSGSAHDILRNDYMRFEEKARDKRAAYGIAD